MDVRAGRGPGGRTGMIANYDAAQDGETPTDRHGGEFQINVISPGFAARTLAAAEVSLIPGIPIGLF